MTLVGCTCLFYSITSEAHIQGKRYRRKCFFDTKNVSSFLKVDIKANKGNKKYSNRVVYLKTDCVFKQE